MISPGMWSRPHDLDVEASFPVRLLLQTDERIGRHGVRDLDGYVANAAQIVRLPAVDSLVTLGVVVGEQFQIDTTLRVLQKANVQANPPIVKSGIASERGQIQTQVIHRTVGVGCRLKAEHGAV